MIYLDEARRWISCRAIGSVWVVEIHTPDRQGEIYIRYEGPSEERARTIHGQGLIFLAQFLELQSRHQQAPATRDGWGRVGRDREGGVA